MEIVLNGKAVMNFDRKLEEVLEKIKEKPENVGNPKVEFVHYNTTKPLGDTTSLEGADQLKINYFEEDSLSFIAFLYFEKRLFGLNVDEYNFLVSEIKRIHQKIEEKTNNVISLETCTQKVFQWISMRYQKKTTQKAIEFLLPELEKEIQEFEIGIPVNMGIIHQEFRVGEIKISPIQGKIENTWKKELLIDLDIQCAIATVKVKAEPTMAYQIALQKIQDFLDLFRFFLIPRHFPMGVSTCSVHGEEPYRSRKHFFIESDLPVKMTQSLIDSVDVVTLSLKDLKKIQELGFGQLFTIYSKSNKSELENQFLNSIKFFSKAFLTKNPFERFLYIFASLESLLLKDSRESIQKNVAERLSLIISDNLEERKLIIENFNEVYNFRSGMVHHAKKIDLNEKTLRDFTIFMGNVWLGLQHLIYHSSKFQTSKELLESIDHLKLSCPKFSSNKTEEKLASSPEPNPEVL